MNVIRVGRQFFSTETLLAIMREGLRLGARRRTDSQLNIWYFTFDNPVSYNAFWTFVTSQQRMELP